MTFAFFTPSRVEILAVACPTCGAEPREACRRVDGKTHAPRIAQARARLSQRRRAPDTKGNAKATRVARDWLKP